MRHVTLRFTAVFLLVICFILQCVGTKKTARVPTELGALRINIVNLGGPAATYGFSIALYRYGSGSHPGGWPGDTVVGRFAFTENTFLWDSLEPDKYDLWVKFSADVDGDGLDEPVWAPTLVTGLRVGRDSISFADVSPSGIAYAQFGDPGEGAPVAVEWFEHIEPR